MRRMVHYRDLVEARVVGNRVTLDRWIKSQGFPEPVPLGPNSIAWYVDEIEAWLAKRRAEREAATARKKAVGETLTAARKAARASKEACDAQAS